MVVLKKRTERRASMIGARHKRLVDFFGFVFSIAFVFASIPAASSELTVEGNRYAQTVTIAGKTLKLVGAGTRVKWLFDVYTMGAYTESGNCSIGSIRNKDEVKYLRINMLRSVSKKNMAMALNEALTTNTPRDASSELKKQIETFVSYVNQCPKGTMMEMVYIPGKGTVLKHNGRAHGKPIPGKAFARVLWDCYFSPKTCCKSLKSDILRSCK
jgi:Chalcone isomerase-like